ncbi:MAG: hypothetical protein KVP17_001091 [Porospora cf. gigantea B]|uniref:uncharacterized protein n=1 Tax=Porospora cf. gigantea B TaxID=2853592 RepID=UPI003571E819|nr:MAG: hypothetical protein KVP17_001091 [Porospora cf. gigantea B]
MSEESQEGSVGPGVGSALDESIGSIVNELRMGGLGLGGHMQNLTMNIQFEEERPQEPPQDEQQPEPQETSERPTPASASGQSEGRARRRSRIIVRRRERRRRGERAGLSLPMLSAELHTRMQDFASSTSSTLLAAGRALVAAGISLDPAGGSVTLEDETNTSEPTEDPLPRLMQYPIPSLAEVRGLLPWRELYQLETVLEDSLGMDLARQHGQHHWNDFNARFLMVSAAVTLLHHRLQQWLEHMDNVGFIRSYLNAMTLLSAIHARLAVLSAQVFGSLSRSVPPEALEQEWTDDLPLDVDLPQEPAETELPPPLEEATSAEKDVVEEVAPGESVQEIEHGEAEVTRDVKAHSSPVPDPVPSPLREASSCGDAELRAVGVQEAPPLFFQPSPVPRPVTPADFDSALSTLGPGTQTLAKKWLHDPAEFSKKVMKRARCSQHSDSYLSGDWPEPSSNGRLASPEMLLSLNLNKALAKAGCESQAVSSAVREAYILEVLLRIAKKAVTNPDYAEMEATLPSEYAMRLKMQT